jgi:hypothetical protein
MEQVLDERAPPLEIECIFCHKQMHRFLLGKRKILVWVHTGEDVKNCTMVKFDADFVSQMANSLQVWKKDFEKFHNRKKHRLESCHNPK